MDDTKNVVRGVGRTDGTHYGWGIFCPACQNVHIFDNRWVFNGNMVKPTFNGSMLAQWKLDGVDKRCHSHVIDGVIHFCHDCTHSMKDQSVALEPF